MKAEGRSARDADLILEEITSLSFSSLPPEEQAMAEYALLLTRTPWDVTAGETDMLRSVGFDDRGIHDICCITAYFAFVNRISDGLGVDLEEHFPQGRGEQ